MKMIAAFQHWWLSRRILRRVRKLDRRLEKVRAIVQVRQREMRSLEKQLISMSEGLAGDLKSVRQEMSDIVDDLDETKQLQKGFEVEFEALRSKLKIAEDVTIPNLVAANKLALERYDADTAAQVRRQAGA